jgi:hypothetical protein
VSSIIPPAVIGERAMTMLDELPVTVARPSLWRCDVRQTLGEGGARNGKRESILGVRTSIDDWRPVTYYPER